LKKLPKNHKMFLFVHSFFIFFMYNINHTGREKGVFQMAKKQLVDLVNRLKKSGIKVSFSKPRSKTLILINQNKNLSSSAN